MFIFNELIHSDQLAVVWVNSPAQSAASASSISADWITIWNKAAYRLCTDGAANVLKRICETSQAKVPQIIIGDFDSISSEARFYFKEKSELSIVGDQNSTDLTKALDILDVRSGGSTESRPLATILLGGLHGRFDHIFGVVNSILLQYKRYSNEFRPIFVIDNENVVTVLPKGETQIMLDHSKISKVCGLFPICQRETIVKTEGFRWNLTKQKLAFGQLVSNSNKILADKQIVTTSEPVVFTFELKEPNVLL